MKKKITAIRGRLVYCIFPVLLLAAAVCIYATAFLPVSAGNKGPSYSVFELISDFLEG